MINNRTLSLSLARKNYSRLENNVENRYTDIRGREGEMRFFREKGYHLLCTDSNYETEYPLYFKSVLLFVVRLGYTYSKNISLEEKRKKIKNRRQIWPPVLWSYFQ